MSDPTILVVEDEPILRMAALAMMDDAGFAAIGAPSSDMAIRILETCPSIRVIFTDVDLGPGADGLSLAFRVRDDWPPVGIIVTSGHRHVSQATIPEGAVFLGKPYLEEQVLDEIRRFA